MSNNQPGQGLGFSASKQIADGLGTPFAAGVPAEQCVGTDFIGVSVTSVIILDSAAGVDTAVRYVPVRIVYDSATSVEAVGVTAESIIVSDSATGSESIDAAIEAPAVEEVPQPVYEAPQGLTTWGWGDWERPVAQPIEHRFESGGELVAGMAGFAESGFIPATEHNTYESDGQFVAGLVSGFTFLLEPELYVYAHDSEGRNEGGVEGTGEQEFYEWYLDALERPAGLSVLVDQASARVTLSTTATTPIGRILGISGAADSWFRSPAREQEERDLEAIILLEAA